MTDKKQQPLVPENDSTVPEPFRKIDAGKEIPKRAPMSDEPLPPPTDTQSTGPRIERE